MLAQEQTVGTNQAQQERVAAAIRVVEAERIAALISQTLKDAKDHFAALSRRDGVAQTETDEGDIVEALDKSRRTFNAEILKSGVNAATFEQVTQTKVNVKKFDAAVELGTIDTKKVADAITETPYTAVKVYWAD